MTIRGVFVTKPPRLHAFFGSELRRARVRAGLSQEEFAAKVIYSRGQIGMIETGRRLSTEDVITRIDDSLGEDGRLLRLWEMARASSPSGILADLIAAEGRATAIRQYNPVLVPGLLQTEGYMRALFGNALFAGADASEIDEQVSQRLARQEILDGDGSPHYIAILDEAVINRTIGSAEVMRAQLDHVEAMMHRRNVTIQIMPATTYPASGPITILDTPSGLVAHLESPVNAGQTTSEPSILQESVEQFELLRAQALPLADSLQLIKQRIEELHS